MKAALRTLARRAICALRPRTLVLAYHHVADPATTAPWVTVSLARFAEQMAYLADKNLVVPLDDLLRDLRQQRVRRGGHVVITFDDAALDTYTAAFPILRRLGLPATLFVPTGLVGRQGEFWWDRLARLHRAAGAQGRDLGTFLVRAGFFQEAPREGEDALWRQLRLLDHDRCTEALDQAAQWLALGTAGPQGPMHWEQLADLDASGLFTFGAHTVSHPALLLLEDDRLTAELTGCRDALAGFRCFRNVFAYPYGDAPVIGARVQRAVWQAGFEAAFTTEETALTGREDRMTLGRVCVDEMSVEQFRWVIDHHLAQ
jgi:peptidoglycan/xylan/chitin deacetylase (PgdA/CDA1 family)